MTGLDDIAQAEMDLNPAWHAHQKMRAALDAAALAVLRSGQSWGEGPVAAETDGRWVAGEPPFILRLTVKGGAVAHDWVPPHGWRVIRHADWVAAGRPGA